MAALAFTACGPTEQPPQDKVGVAEENLAIAGLFATGVDNLGAPLAIGGVDGHYTLTSNDPLLPGPSALVVTPHAGWTANTGSSTWISAQASTAGNMGSAYTYTATFSLVAVDPATASISGKWACDGTCTVSINGTAISQAIAGGPGALTAFSIPSGSPFQLGTNTLSFQVKDTAGPQGIHVNSITGKVAVCSIDSQCAANQYCNTQTTNCASKVANGGAIPVVASHTPPLTGVCNAAVGVAVCVSGVCDTIDDKCGYANGDGACDAMSGPTVCRSGICSVQGSCLGAGNCLADADCAAGKWCNETTGTCTLQITNGSAIPSDPPHVNPALNGTCTQAAGALVCKSLVCDTDNLCGYRDGDGMCTAITGATVCRSTHCSLSGVCVKTAGGCNIDPDCPGKWCNEGTNACTSLVANGAAMPIDAPHVNPTLDGTCTQIAASLVCAGKVCSTVDNKCGYLNGEGPCDSMTGATVCRSTHCSATGFCVKIAGGCNVDADCSGKWCNETTNTCTSFVANGSAMPIDATHMNPILDGTCNPAAASLVCASQVCSVSDNKCGYVNGDGPCDAASEGTVCRSKHCTTGGTCVKVAGGCNVDSDCAASEWCNQTTNLCVAKSTNGQALPVSMHTPVNLDGQCNPPEAAVACLSGACDVSDMLCGLALGHGPCAGSPGVCRSNACSVAGTCEPLGGCNVDADCPMQWCNEVAHACKALLSNGTPIPTDAAHANPALTGKCTAMAGSLVCASGVCDTVDDKCGYADGDGMCTMGNANIVCRSGLCNAGGKCAPASGCASDTDCTGGKWCDETAHACAPKLDNGGTIPNDPAHANPTLNGKCAQAAAVLVCNSGVCDAVDDKCGYADGDGACNAGNASTLCRSGGCGPQSGLCTPVGGCALDGDCTADQYCDTSAFACVAKLANGQAIPKLTKHTPPVDGKCTQASGAVVCASGVCDPSDDKCGYASGDGACTDMNAPTVCRSMKCGAMGPNAGKCVDCDTDMQCTKAAPVCVANLCVQCDKANATLCGDNTPACDDATNTCVACDGDSGSGAGHPCVIQPFCHLTGANQGSCGLCSTDAECVSHGSVACDKATGACVGTCSKDTDCPSKDWCDAPAGGMGNCVAKLANGTALPAKPAEVAQCTMDVGARVCVSGICDTKDDTCGLAPGDGSCKDDSACRTTLCDVAKGTCKPAPCASDSACAPGQFCGIDGSCISALAPGGLCTRSSQCASNLCEAGQCQDPNASSGCSTPASTPASTPDSGRPDSKGALTLLGLAALAWTRRRASGSRSRSH